MSWNMFIFGFGFILGGFTGVLILGLVCFPREQTAHSESSEFGREPRQDAANPVIFPKLTVLNGRKAPYGFTRETGNRKMTTLR